MHIRYFLVKIKLHEENRRLPLRKNMKLKIQGWISALLFVTVLGLGGCSGRREVYLAGASPAELSAGETETGQETEPETEAKTASGPDVRESESAAAGYVYVCGAVEAPGVYPVREGMRVFEAVGLAGGFSREADQEWLNQAEPVQDGQKLYVYTKAETRELARARQESGAAVRSEDLQAAQETGEAGAEDHRVNLNTADRETLKTLPGIGDAKADSIIQYREEHGPFGSAEEIQNISGIKSAVFSKIKNLITV